jgi:hypothetical protein
MTDDKIEIIFPDEGNPKWNEFPDKLLKLKFEGEAINYIHIMNGEERFISDMWGIINLYVSGKINWTEVQRRLDIIIYKDYILTEDEI